MKQKLYLLLGDVISSRRIGDREKFQNKFEDMLENINIMYSEDIYANFKILKGIDEIGGVLSDISNSYKIMTTIAEQLYPVRMRFALIFDYIDIGLESKNISKMDGVAFHKASDILNTLKKSKLMFDISTTDKMMDSAIAGQINLILLTKKNWSAKQYQIFEKYKSINNQDDVARYFSISQQAVSKTLNRIMWKEIVSIEENLNSLLYDYAHKLHTVENIQ